jgi:hypothetical protein
MKYIIIYVTLRNQICLFYFLTNTKQILQQSPFGELDGHLTGQDNPYLLWSLKDHYHLYRGISLNTIQIWLNPEKANLETSAMSFLLRKEQPGRNGWTLVTASQTITHKRRL